MGCIRSEPLKPNPLVGSAQTRSLGRPIINTERTHCMKTKPKRQKKFLNLPPKPIKALRHMATEMGLILGPGLCGNVESDDHDHAQRVGTILQDRAGAIADIASSATKLSDAIRRSCFGAGTTPSAVEHHAEVDLARRIEQAIGDLELACCAIDKFSSRAAQEPAKPSVVIMRKAAESTQRPKPTGGCAPSF